MDSFRSRFHLSALFEFQPRSLDGNIYRGSLPRPLVALLLRARQHDDREKPPASCLVVLLPFTASIGTCPTPSLTSLPSSSLIHFMEFVRLGLFALLITFRSYLPFAPSLPPSLYFSLSLLLFLLRGKFHGTNGWSTVSNECWREIREICDERDILKWRFVRAG